MASYIVILRFDHHGPVNNVTSSVTVLCILLTSRVVYGNIALTDFVIGYLTKLVRISDYIRNRESSLWSNRQMGVRSFGYWLISRPRNLASGIWFHKSYLTYNWNQKQKQSYIDFMRVAGNAPNVNNMGHRLKQFQNCGCRFCHRISNRIHRQIQVWIGGNHHFVVYVPSFYCVCEY